ncbi:hypothetical protein [Pseudodesulfovibrio pelocollis]|uniref:hypothetical protein n=1 Tax=Pseudodesulfovibrio pelocollis TaxID=3051432 RepID=UPI00255B059B|nr:hypothetical protein [Pseudodesulfovibrio sp. SB368]
MATTVEEITINYSEDNQLIVKELDKVVLSKGAWTIIVFRYQEFNRAKGEFGPEKFSIRRYQKVDGTYRPKSKFNISSQAQAQKIVEALGAWID